MDAQARRRERRAEKQAQWKAANPLLVGVDIHASCQNATQQNGVSMIGVTG